MRYPLDLSDTALSDDNNSTCMCMCMFVNDASSCKVKSYNHQKNFI